MEPLTQTIIRTRGPRPDLSLFPNLFYLGPQRTGSTWLHANLSRHPEAHLHRDKETFYFSTLGDAKNPRYRHDFLEDYLANFRESSGSRLLKHYHAMRRCGLLYRPKVRGDFTASYGVLNPTVIRQIVALQPELRGIILVRDPLERAWSHAKKDLLRGRAVRPDISQLLNFMRSPEQLIRADYNGIIRRWQDHLQPGHIFVAPSGRISSDPAGLIDDICGFLGIRRLGGPSRRHLSSRQNVTSAEAVPENLRPDLEKVLGEAQTSFRLLMSEIGPGKIY